MRAVVRHLVIHRTVIHPGVRVGSESTARSESETGAEKRDGERGKGTHGVCSFFKEESESGSTEFFSIVSNPLPDKENPKNFDVRRARRFG